MKWKLPWHLRYFKDQTSGCHKWMGGKDSWGYGVVCLNSKAVGAHRAAYEKHVGAIPPGMIICHSCDTPSCINPAHMWIGTHADNANDKARKGRTPKTNKTFSLNGKRNRPKELVMEIKKRLAEGVKNQSALAREFGVSSGFVNHIFRGTRRASVSARAA
jgi:hypothetical protein